MSKHVLTWHEVDGGSVADLGVFVRLHVTPLAGEWYAIDMTTNPTPGDDTRVSMIRARQFRAESLQAAQQACVVAALDVLHMLSGVLLTGLR